jgi:hypothetical protein
LGVGLGGGLGGALGAGPCDGLGSGLGAVWAAESERGVMDAFVMRVEDGAGARALAAAPGCDTALRHGRDTAVTLPRGLAAGAR